MLNNMKTPFWTTNNPSNKERNFEKDNFSESLYLERQSPEGPSSWKDNGCSFFFDLSAFCLLFCRGL